MAKQLMTPSEALVETLAAEGVEHVFGIVGSAFMDALDLFPSAGIRFISVAHEQAAAHAADALARVTGRPQVCIAQNGPGIANFVSGITAAYWAHSPVVCITPETGSMGLGNGGFQELDQMPMFEKSTVYQVRVNDHERMAELARQCFYRAKVENGPTQLNIPRNKFYGEAEYEVYPSLNISRGAGPRANLEETLALLGNAKNPVILAGGGVSQADAQAEIKDLAEYMTIPVVNTYLHNDSFPNDHPLAVGPIGYCGSKAAMRTIKEADVVLALGTRLGPFGTLPQYDMEYWPKDAKIIQVDVNHKVLGLTMQVDVASLADVKEFTRELTGMVKAAHPGLRPDEDKMDEIAAENARWNEEKHNWGADQVTEAMHPRRLLSELSKAVPKNALVATDIGNTCSMSNDYFHFEGARQHLSALSWGNCGFSVGAAMGAKLGKPDAPVFAFTGDGAYGIGGLAEIMTLVREEIPVITIVANNKEWGAEKKNQIDFYGDRFIGSNLRQNPDYAQLARDMGAVGIKVERQEDVNDAIQEAMAAGRPVVIDAVIEGGEAVLAEPFRRDALKLPARKLGKYASTNAVQ
ncbi:MAG: sulfoacetaldehyde acetyltransferase [Anaerolineae bacterium]